MKARMFSALVFALFALACGNDPRPKVEPTPEPALDPSAAKPETPKPEVPDPSAEELPLPQDFETEVAEQITAQNFRAELERLEREIAVQQQK